MHRSVTRFAPLLALVFATPWLGGGVGCIDRPLEPVEPRSTSVVVEAFTVGGVDKIDLLLAIDDSKSMADKQRILALAVPDLVRRLANPVCVDVAGRPSASQPGAPTEPCPLGSAREFDAVLDIHVGIISSSLAGQGSAFCKGESEPAMAHLSTRGADGAPAQTYEGMGFLAWDPEARLDPPGESVLGEDADRGLVPALADLVQGVGQEGCGFEAQLESWYRFLVDPEPYAELRANSADLVPVGTDELVLRQRADFLRPDSLVAIVMLTDENDCSIVPSSVSAEILDGDRARPRAECAVDVTDPCCLPCDAPLSGTSCPVDPTCFDEAGAIRRDTEENVRCFETARRFGEDILQPVARYVDALTAPAIADRSGELVPNPLFPDASTHANARTPERVFFAGIVGVPWQDIAKNPSDLADGGFKTVAELDEVDPATGVSGWDLVLGDRAAGVAPRDPLMRESIGPRSGPHPLTGERVGPAGTVPDNAINGHERVISDRDDLQYACTFALPGDPLVCDPSDPSCDCYVAAGETPDDEQNPLCRAPDGSYGTTQYAAKAYPGVRHLEVLRGLGEQGIVASVCPAYIGSERDRPDFGYAPAIAALVDRLKTALRGRCLPRTLTPDENGQVSCLVLEARADETCACEGASVPVAEEHRAAVDAARQSAAGQEAHWSCFCELPQLTGDELRACQVDTSPAPVVDGEPVDGWCYVDGTTHPPLGDPSLVEACPENEERLLRFVGEARLPRGRTMIITCAGE